MSVIISVIGANQQSDEYQCAEQLKEILEAGLPKNVLGEIVLHANATLVGQTVKDVDIMMMGTLSNYILPLDFMIDETEHVRENIEITSFCTTIEVKAHPAESIFREGTDFYVMYRQGPHSVTTQSNMQKISAMNFFRQIFGGSPYITNIIWFTGVSREELSELLKIGNKKLPSNVLQSEFAVKELMQTIVRQKTPVFYHGNFHFDSCGSFSIEELKRSFQTFARAKQGMGDLTRRRIEQITSNAINDTISKPHGDEMILYRGKAGTGKTVGLIKTAIKLVDEEDARVIILTYNRALVSDIRRLFTLAELPDMFADACVSITTMQSFFYNIVSNVLYDGELLGPYYLEHYEDLLRELLDLLYLDKESVDMVKSLLMDKKCFTWDYCLIDEAQDWTDLERDLILLLFGFEKVIVADGGQQFVRENCICDWSVVKARKNIKLKYCLRQKNNLIKFVNHCIADIGFKENKIYSSNKLPGGKIIISYNPGNFWNICREELGNLKKAGNIEYDMLFLVPHTMVNSNGERYFIHSMDFKRNGFNIWDGTNDNVRTTFSVSGSEERVIQYDSARGLEAWTVVCLDFDVFLEEKLRTFHDDRVAQSLFLESAEDRKLKFLLNWFLIPVTRAIDTLIITLHNLDSPIAVMLKKIAEENSDYIRFV